MTAQCWLARYGVHERGPMPRCEGRLVRAHLLPKRMMLRELPAEVSAWASDDPRGWVYACGGITGCTGHHGQMDVSRSLRVPYERLPAGVLELAAELDSWCVGEPFMVFLAREYGEQRRAA
jgi:hypothetical protein